MLLDVDRICEEYNTQYQIDVNFYLILKREFSQYKNITCFKYFNTNNRFINEFVFVLIVNYCIEHYRQNVITFYTNKGIFKRFFHKYTSLPANLKFNRSKKCRDIESSFIYKKNVGLIKMLSLVKFFVLFKKIQKYTQPHVKAKDYYTNIIISKRFFESDYDEENYSNEDENPNDNDEKINFNEEGSDARNSNENGNSDEEEYFLSPKDIKYADENRYELNKLTESGESRKVTILMKCFILYQSEPLDIGFPNEKNRKIWLPLSVDLYKHFFHLFHMHRYLTLSSFYTHLYKLYLLLVYYHHNVAMFFRLLLLYYQALYSHDQEKKFLCYFLHTFNLLPKETRNDLIQNSIYICRTSEVLRSYPHQKMKMLLKLIFLHVQYNDNAKTLKYYFSNMKMYTYNYIKYYLTYSCFNDRNINLYKVLCSVILANESVTSVTYFNALLPRRRQINELDKYYFAYFVKLIWKELRTEERIYINRFILATASRYYPNKNLSINDIINT